MRLTIHIWQTNSWSLRGVAARVGQIGLTSWICHETTCSAVNSCGHASSRQQWIFSQADTSEPIIADCVGQGLEISSLIKLIKHSLKDTHAKTIFIDVIFSCKRWTLQISQQRSKSFADIKEASCRARQLALREWCTASQIFATAVSQWTRKWYLARGVAENWRWEREDCSWDLIDFEVSKTSCSKCTYINPS